MKLKIYWLKALLLVGLCITVASSATETKFRLSDSNLLNEGLFPEDLLKPNKMNSIAFSKLSRNQTMDNINDGKKSIENSHHISNNNNKNNDNLILIKNKNFNNNPKIINESNFIWTRAERDADENAVSACHDFEVGDPDQNTLTSPNYPNDYPKSIDCIRILEAREGYIIRLDFRNSFNIEEKEDCKFDYLEVRDGQYGFSNLLGKFCGQNFPPMLDSKGRHLWLHFHSDDSIEYSGFTAIYEFIKTPEDSNVRELNCIIEKGGSEGFINNTDITKEVVGNATMYKIPIDCLWIIKVKENWKIQIKFQKFELIKPNDCDINFIDIFNEKTEMANRLKNFCGSAGDSVISTINILYIRFYAEPLAINSTFDILYTAYREKIDSCTEDEYDCEDATCISAELKCNGRDNCKFRWDEEGCEDKSSGQSEHVIIIIIVFGLILGGMVASFLVNCIRKILKDQKIIREHIRQSKESKLDEMGRNSAKRSRENLSVKLPISREKLSQGSLQILDDVSKRYYRDVTPISNQDNRLHLKDDTIMRHDILIQTSLTDDSAPTPPERHMDIEGTCDMGCQTRESLFQPVGWKMSVLSSSRDSGTGGVGGDGGGIRFSTFGYDDGGPLSSTVDRIQKSVSHQAPQHQHSTNNDKYSKSRARSSATIEINKPNLSEIPQSQNQNRKPLEVCLHHHQHQQHLQQQQQQQQQQQHHQQQQESHQPGHQKEQHLAISGKGKQKDIDVRNSAPDVIIMTSH